jgi:hypothetical protein
MSYSRARKERKQLEHVASPELSKPAKIKLSITSICERVRAKRAGLPPWPSVATLEAASETAVT